MKPISVLLTLLLPTLAAADVLELANGDRLTGTVDSIEGGKVLLVTEYAGSVPVDLSVVTAIQTDAPLQVNVGGETVSGLFSTEEGQVRLGDRTVVLADVGRASRDNLSGAALGQDWSSRADLSLVLSSGNTDTRNLNTLVESVYKKDTVQHSFAVLVSNEEADETTTKDQLDVDYAYKRFMSEKWYVAGNAEYFRDELKDIDERITLGAGAGYQFWDNSLGALSMELGVSAVREDLDGEQEDNPAVRWALEYKRFLLAKRMELFHKNALLMST